ncbi:MAG: potassium/proton antiporter [Paludibacteraceae bacterium]|nr:potassium/proton antiporter [Paludibacteraceae bacterium]
MEVPIFLLVVSLMFFASIFTDKLSTRFGMPALLLFLGVGMLFGEEGLGIEFNEISTAEGISTVALCVILFSGGMNTRFQDIRSIMREGVTLATLGVLLTCVISGVVIYFILRWTHAGEEISLLTALLMAATMSSTDAASVFSILRTQGTQLKHNLRPILELESGSNDPMAYILTVTFINIITGSQTGSWWMIIITIVWQIVAGFFAGFGLGKFIVWLMQKVKMSNESLYPVLILTSCIFIFSVTWLIGGNNYMAVYIGGLVIGNSKFAHKRLTNNFFDGLSWLLQLTMFLVLGLLVTPSHLLDVIVPGLIVSVVMIFVSRPLSVFLSMIPFKWLNFKDKVFLSWVGLKGAVPIIFAIQCMAADVPHSDTLFNIAFFCTLISLLLQGGSLSRIADKLGLSLPEQPKIDPTHFDIDLPEEILKQTKEVEVTQEMAPSAITLKSLNIPSKSLVILIKRGDEYIVPKGSTEVEAGDYLLMVSESQTAIVAVEENNIWQLKAIQDTAGFLKNLKNKRLFKKFKFK